MLKNIPLAALLGMAVLAMPACRSLDDRNAANQSLDVIAIQAAEAAQKRQAALDRAEERKQQLRERHEAMKAQMIGDVSDRLSLPSTYNQTVVIAPDAEPLELPEGPMEAIVNQPVSMSLDDAGVKDIIMALSQVDGLNIIADEALTEQQRLTINVTDVPLHELLSYLARNMGVAFYVGHNTIWVTATNEMTTGPKLETRIIKLQRGFIPSVSGGAAPRGGGGVFGNEPAAGEGGEDEELDTALQQIIGADAADVSYEIFRDRNLLIITAPRQTLRIVEQVIRELDKAPLQVLIEARFVNLSQTDFFELGADLEKLMVDTGEKLALDFTSNFPEALVADTFGGKLALSGILGNTTYAAVIRALEKRDDINTLTSPRITVVNNRQATITDGRKQYYYEDYDLESIDDGDEGTRTRLVPTGSPTELDYGISLAVKPNIGNDGKTIMLALAPRITVPDGEGFEEFPVGDTGSIRLPKYFESSLQTTAVVESGQTIVLGGTMSHTKASKVTKVPFLGDLPIIKYLFRHKNREDSPQHLLIFVTASIINPRGEFVETVDP